MGGVAPVASIVIANAYAMHINGDDTDVFDRCLFLSQNVRHTSNVEKTLKEVHLFTIGLSHDLTR